MSDGAEQISFLQNRLAIYRRTVAYLDDQRARYGGLTPVHIHHQLDEARQQIALAKADLLALGISADHVPGDTASDREFSADQPFGRADASLQAYLRMLLDRLGYLSLDGLSQWRGPAPRLSELYVERMLLPVSSGALPATLASLVADRHARLLLEGEPGSGKSIAVRRLVLACAAATLGDSREPPLFTRLPDPPLVPLLLEVSDLLAAISGSSRNTQIGFWEVIEQTMRRDGLNSLVPVIEHALRSGDCLVVLDGLDDIAGFDEGRMLLATLGRFIARYPDSRYVITCRNTAVLPSSALFGCTSYRVPALDDAALDQLVAKYYPVVAPLSALVFDDLDARIAQLRSHLQANERLRLVAANPLGAAVCVLTEAEGKSLPAHRGQVFARMIDLLLDRWEQLRNDAQTPTLAQLLDVELLTRREYRLVLLQSLALAFQSRPDLEGDTPAVLRTIEIEPWLRDSLMRMGVDNRRSVETVIPRLLSWCERQGLLIGNATGTEYVMPWRSLREYLAACELAAQPDFPERAYTLATEPRWRETLLLALHELSESPAAHTAREVLRLLLESASYEGRAVRDVLLAADALRESDLSSVPMRHLLAETQERLLEIIGISELTPNDRVRAGSLLGLLGDPRFNQVLPPLVRVPGGTFLLGTRDGYEDEGPPQWVDVPAFAIGTYAVTNREYARFLADAPDHPLPKYWHDQRYNNPSHPVVGVTWNDAIAYCHWLTVRLRDAGVLPQSMEVRLPLEIEWEKAASWDAKRRVKRVYPWGDSWKTGAANTTEGRGTWVTAAVGCYPDGMSPCGAHDMIGNVWEWTASQYSSYPGALAPFAEHEAYTLRGSSCASLPTHARCTYRSRLPPTYWRYHLGFRIVLARPLDQLA